MSIPGLAAELASAVDAADDHGLARAALLLARLEYQALDPAPWLAQIDAMGEAARRRLEPYSPGQTAARVEALAAFLFGELGFSGNESHYDDPRNSFLNQVLERRTGIPITLSVIYMEVARRCGLRAEGVNFPGHFLVRVPADGTGDLRSEDLIVDPFHGGALLTETGCRQLLRKHCGDDVAFDRRLMAPASPLQIIVRMLVNLKRVYVKFRSFPQARTASDLLLALDPTAHTELRDRGLLSYHMRDFSTALRDLEGYLRLTSRTGTEADADDRAEYEQIWEHVKTIRRRLASFN